jgi:hypothetical protein
MATTVRRTRHNVTLYVHCLSSRLYFASIFIDTSVQYIPQSTATSLLKGLFDFKVNVFSGTDVYRVTDEHIANCTQLHLLTFHFLQSNQHLQEIVSLLVFLLPELDRFFDHLPEERGHIPWSKGQLQGDCD